MSQPVSTGPTSLTQNFFILNFCPHRHHRCISWSLLSVKKNDCIVVCAIKIANSSKEVSFLLRDNGSGNIILIHSFLVCTSLTHSRSNSKVIWAINSLVVNKLIKPGPVFTGWEWNRFDNELGLKWAHQTQTKRKLNQNIFHVFEKFNLTYFIGTLLIRNEAKKKIIRNSHRYNANL